MVSSRSYNEKVKLYSESGDLLGIALLIGSARISSRSGLWSWEAQLYESDFEPGILMEAGELRIEFEDGAEGRALCQNIRYRNANPSVRLLGTGMPPRVDQG